MKDFGNDIWGYIWGRRGESSREQYPNGYLPSDPIPCRVYGLGEERLGAGRIVGFVVEKGNESAESTKVVKVDDPKSPLGEVTLLYPGECYISDPTGMENEGELDIVSASEYLDGLRN